MISSRFSHSLSSARRERTHQWDPRGRASTPHTPLSFPLLSLPGEQQPSQMSHLSPISSPSSRHSSICADELGSLRLGAVTFV